MVATSAWKRADKTVKLTAGHQFYAEKKKKKKEY